jgi:hypothetical protein
MNLRMSPWAGSLTVIWFLLTLANAAVGEDGPSSRERWDPAQLSWRMGKDCINILPAKPGAEGLLSCAVELGYEHILLMCDRVRWDFSYFPDTRIHVPEHVHVLNGPTGPKPDQVLFDSLATSLPKLGFRGRLTPQRIDAQRVPVPVDEITTPGSLGLVAYRAVFTNLGDFSGDMRAKSRDGQGEWKGVSGWAATVELLLLGDVTPKRVANLRLRQLDFLGDSGDENRPVRLAEIRRYDHPIGGASGAELAKETPAASAKSRRFRLVLDGLGQVMRTETMGWTEGSAANLFPDAIYRAQPAPGRSGAPAPR